ncbi:MAG: Co2+/Mg2+ efflux protein ApaG [Bacteroidota bacterium]
MDTLITNDIKISVENFFQPGYSQPASSQFVFAYRVSIENLSSETVQLLRRHWFIKDANGTLREVEGEGVIGKQPIIAPGGMHQYVSWCNLSTSIGKMYGTYQMLRRKDNYLFDVTIPAFKMIVPHKLN